MTDFSFFHSLIGLSPNDSGVSRKKTIISIPVIIAKIIDTI
jgi:hypothetical protein